ncbi:hypothetical protein QI222_04070 [Staphylococcus saprophyticus]|uniref:hypothetical protein n=1 Tax=Staphylococcus saprophyticus TaxID=29385 RepID=UPI0011A6D85E|nr:hypothetical protein [Staphylococcus saprophyticus]MDW4104112.1 hypothetical protein [Staphylococcus saprophyticus]MDW4205197.1 hypothetical protein [Staphylococcus saprophyticus]
MTRETQMFWLDKILALAIERYNIAQSFDNEQSFDDVIEAYADNDPLEHIFMLMPNDFYQYVIDADKEIANEYDKNIEDYTPYMN